MNVEPSEISELIGPGWRWLAWIQHQEYLNSPRKGTLKGNKWMRSSKELLRPTESSDILSAQFLWLTPIELKAIKELRVRIAQDIIASLNISGSSGWTTTGSNLATCTEREKGSITLEKILNDPNFTLDIFIAEYLEQKK